MNVRTLEDAGREISLLRTEMDRLRSQNIDLTGRRIINAGDSTDPADYVTRRELNAIQATEATQQLFPGVVIIDLSLGSPAVGDDISSPQPVVYMPREQFGVPVFCGARLDTAPSGGDFTMRWNHFNEEEGTSDDLFDGSLLTVSSGSNWGFITDFKENRNVAGLDYFTFDITAVNNAVGLYTFLALRVN